MRSSIQRLAQLAFGPALLLAPLGCATVAKNGPDAVKPGHTGVVSAHEKVLGFGRTYRLHVPASVDADSDPRPLVVALHGGVASGRIFEQQTGFSELADEHGFLVVYPNGIGIFGLLRHWNAQWCCAKAMRARIDDQGFVDRVIEAVAADWPVDRNRVFVVGYSNGGMLAHQYAASRAERLAGLAVFAGPAGVRDAAGVTTSVAPKSPLPVMVIHGKTDERLAFDGKSPTRPILGAAESGRLWALSNGCEEEPQRDAAGALERVRFCRAGAAPVEVLLLDAWGHEWPGPRGTGKLALEKPLAGFDLGTEIWSFFSKLQPLGVAP